MVENDNPLIACDWTKLQCRYVKSLKGLPWASIPLHFWNPLPLFSSIFFLNSLLWLLSYWSHLNHSCSWALLVLLMPVVAYVQRVLKLPFITPFCFPLNSLLNNSKPSASYLSPWPFCCLLDILPRMHLLLISVSYISFLLLSFFTSIFYLWHHH